MTTTTDPDEMTPDQWALWRYDRVQELHIRHQHLNAAMCRVPTGTPHHRSLKAEADQVREALRALAVDR